MWQIFGVQRPDRQGGDVHCAPTVSSLQTMPFSALAPSCCGNSEQSCFPGLEEALRLLVMAPVAPEARSHPPVPAQGLGSGDPIHVCPVAAGMLIPARPPAWAVSQTRASRGSPSLTQPCPLPPTQANACPLSAMRGHLCRALASSATNSGQISQALLSQEHLD